MKKILENYNLENVDIIKQGYYSSKTSSRFNFLEATNPSIALISAGKDNSFNHPHEEVTKRLNKFKIETSIP